MIHLVKPKTILQFRRYKERGRWYEELYWSSDPLLEGLFLHETESCLGRLKNKLFSFRTRDEALAALHTYKKYYPQLTIRSGTWEIK